MSASVNEKGKQIEYQPPSAINFLSILMLGMTLPVTSLSLTVSDNDFEVSKVRDGVMDRGSCLYM